MAKRTVELTFERERLLIVGRRRVSVTAWCRDCRARVQGMKLLWTMGNGGNLDRVGPAIMPSSEPNRRPKLEAAGSNTEE